MSSDICKECDGRGQVGTTPANAVRDGDMTDCSECYGTGMTFKAFVYHHNEEMAEAYDPYKHKPEFVAEVINTHKVLPWPVVIEPRGTTEPRIGTMMISCPHPDLAHDCCIWCGMNMANREPRIRIQ